MSTSPPTSTSKKKSKGRIFQCTGYPDCNMNFTRSEHLARHIRKHTGERPFKCPHCSRKFSRLDNLRQHKQTVHAYENFVITYPGDKVSVRMRNEEGEGDCDSVMSEEHVSLNQQPQQQQQINSNPSTPVTTSFISPPNSSSPATIQIHQGNSQQQLPPANPSLLRPLQFRPKRHRPRPLSLPQNSNFITNSNPNTPLSMVSPLSPLYNHNQPQLITPTSATFSGSRTSPYNTSFPPINEVNHYNGSSSPYITASPTVTLPPLPVKFAPSDFNPNAPHSSTTEPVLLASRRSSTESKRQVHELPVNGRRQSNDLSVRRQSYELSSGVSPVAPVNNSHTKNWLTSVLNDGNGSVLEDQRNDHEHISKRATIDNLLTDGGPKNEKFKLPSVNNLGL